MSDDLRMWIVEPAEQEVCNMCSAQGVRVVAYCREHAPEHPETFLCETCVRDLLALLKVRRRRNRVLH